MAKNDVQRVIDRPRSRGGGGTAVSVAGGGGTVDLTPYLLLDGSRAMTGSLNMGNFSITNVSLVDGTDIYAHVTNPDAHHGMLHDLDSTANHTGTLSWAKVSKTGSNITDIVLRAHNNLQSIGPNDHHNQVHNIVGSDHTVSGFALDVVGLNGTNTLAVLTPSYLPGATPKILRTDDTGTLTIEKLIGTQYVKSSAYIEATSYVSAPTYVNTPKIQHAATITLEPTVDLIFNPGSNLVKLKNGKALQTESFTSGFAGHGFRLDQGMTSAGITTLQIDDVFVRGRMHVYELLIQQIRATNGSVFISSVAKAAGVSSLGGSSYRITTDGENAHGFLVGDLIRAQRVKWNGSSFAGVYQSNMQVTSVTNLYTFDATLVSGDVPAAGFEFVRLGSVSDVNRRGSIYLTSDDASAPFIDIINDVDSFADWNTAAVSKMRIGKLDGITGGSNEYGFIAGAGGYSNSVKYIKASNLGVRLNNIDLQLWNDGTQRVNIDNLGSDTWFKDASGNVKLSWNGSVLSVVGSITITSGSGYANFSDKPTSLSGINSTEGTKLSGIATGATVGATWGTNLYSIPTRFGDAPSTSGLYMTASNLGFYNGSAWKVWVDNSGYFYFGGSTGESLRWDGAKLGGYNSSNVLQWSAGTLGSFVGFAAGIVGTFAYTRLDANGLLIYRSTWSDTAGTPEPGYGTAPNTAPSAYNSIDFYDTVDYWTHTYPGQVVSGNYNGGLFFRMYGSSKHLVPVSEEWGSWAHYYDGVIEVTNPSLGSFGGGITNRLWLKSSKIVVDGDLSLGQYTSTGKITLGNQATNGNLGFIQWYNGNTRMGYMGYDYSYVRLQLENTYDFLIDGGTVGIQAYPHATYVLSVGGDIAANNFRSSGSAGWISESYGGGWFMQDTSWIRSLNSKSVWINTGYFGSDGGLTIGYGGAAPTTGGAIILNTVTIGSSSPNTAYKIDVRGEGYISGVLRSDVAFGLKEVAEPTTSATYGFIFIDSADGDLKVKFKNGNVFLLKANT